MKRLSIAVSPVLLSACGMPLLALAQPGPPPVAFKVRAQLRKLAQIR